MFGCKMEKTNRKIEKNCTVRTRMICIPNQTILVCTNAGEQVGQFYSPASSQFHQLYSSISLSSISFTFLLLSAPSVLQSCGTYFRQFYSPAVLNSICSTVLKVKGKSVPLQAWSGPVGSRKLRYPDYMTTAPDGGKVVSPTHRPPLPPGNTPGTHFC